MTYPYESPHLLPAGTQMSMTGEDWTSERDKNRQKKAEAKRKQTALACAAKLEAGATALRDFLSACNDCRDLSGDEKLEASDGRRIMIEQLSEYSIFLRWKYEK
jgi:hypothetical protein